MSPGSSASSSIVVSTVFHVWQHDFFVGVFDQLVLGRELSS